MAGDSGSVAALHGDRDGNEPPETSSAGKRRRRPEKFTDFGLLNHLLKEKIHVYPTDTVYDTAVAKFVRYSDLTHMYGSDNVRMYKASDLRTVVNIEEIDFDPTLSRPEVKINLFRGFALQPRKGDHTPWLEILRHLTSRASQNADECDEVMHWLLQWMALPLQRPGTKHRTAIVMHGDEGAGKNMVFDVLLAIYGEYGTVIGQPELEDKFNDWGSRKLMIVGDEVCTRQEVMHHKGRGKALITGTTIQINPKNLPRRQERNHANFVFLSNEIQPLALDNSDRRYLVIFTPPARERAFYQRMRQWFEDDGPAAVYDYLLHYDCSDFDPFAPPPLTDSKRDLIDLGLRSAERFWLEWAGGELDLPYANCSASQAYRAYLRYAQRTGDRYPVQENVFARMVIRVSESRAGAMDVRAVRSGKATWDVGGRRRTARLFLVTDPPLAAESYGAWARDCVTAFERDLSTFLGPSRSLGDESTGAGGAA